MNIKTFKFIDKYSNGIVVNFDNRNKKTVTISLFLDNENIETISTNNDHYLFKVDKSGNYHVTISFIDSNKNIHHLIDSPASYYFTQQKTKQNIKKESKSKTINHKIDGINKYFLEIKSEIKSSHLIMDILPNELMNSKLILIKSNIESSIKQYEYLNLYGEDNFDRLLELSQKIEQLDYVSYCCICPDTTGYLPPKLPLNSQVLEEDTSSNEITPNFTYLQKYLDAPMGMNVRNAWEKNIDGSQAVVRHLDFGVYKNHEDLKNSNLIVVSSRPETQDCNHGTASTGCIIATKNAFGVTGIAHNCQFYFYDTDDLDQLTNDAQPGDIVSLDIQFSFGEKLLPATAVRNWWERIKIMVDKGATVILAAGNGGLDLSEPGVMTDFGDNGSMLVGACNNQTGSRAYFSNYNQKSSLINSWGDWSVTTTGYGSLQKYPGNERNYTKDYSGTSSATPLCAGALALLQGYAKQHQIILSAWGMRELIRKSTYTEGVNDGIGYRPNVNDLLKEIDKLAQITE
ncbi:peptidase [Providencia rettgeri]|uniref:S8 family serine peptidase n=1 Tax=Providencia rettgeri TaxID=587 RepID=UPI000E3E147F|nr:S8 family serine peptidase [Providencia rettgeri]RFT09876.1 peptidase [Providencia rettgeri]